MLNIILLVLVLLLLCASIFFLAKWVFVRKDLEEEQLDNDDLDQKNQLLEIRLEQLRAEIAGLQQQKDEAYENLETVLDSRPGPFDHVVTELGLKGVVYQFRNKDFYENMKEVSA